MTDLALIWNDAAANADLGLLGADLATDDGLRTAIIISLFSDRLARADDDLPDNTADRRGWWGDSFPQFDGDLIGSRLWLLDRAKEVPATLTSAQDYAVEALAWLIEDGLATTVSAEAVWTAPGALGLTVTVTRPDGEVAGFYFLWEASA